MRIVYEDHETLLDFRVPTLDEARDYIHDGATNGVELLEDAGMTTAEAKRELKRIEREMLPGYVVFPEPDEDAS